MIKRHFSKPEDIEQKGIQLIQKRAAKVEKENNKRIDELLKRILVPKKTKFKTMNNKSTCIERAVLHEATDDFPDFKEKLTKRLNELNETYPYLELRYEIGGLLSPRSGWIKCQFFI